MYHYENLCAINDAPGKYSPSIFRLRNGHDAFPGMTIVHKHYKSRRTHAVVRSMFYCSAIAFLVLVISHAFVGLVNWIKSLTYFSCKIAKATAEREGTINWDVRWSDQTS